ncbi:integral membrane transport protein [Streptomyces sp. NPDC001815]|uniref:integral membrane transport protein n=1 Tax=Streptomyces sp. NPDC001815 TaxID=3154526 RepID=UPI0033246C36
MSAVTDAVRTVAPGGSLGQSVRDSLVVAKRNLIRIPNPLRRASIQSNWLPAQEQRMSVGKEQVA